MAAYNMLTYFQTLLSLKNIENSRIMSVIVPSVSGYRKDSFSFWKSSKIAIWNFNSELWQNPHREMVRKTSFIECCDWILFAHMRFISTIERMAEPCSHVRTICTKGIDCAFYRWHMTINSITNVSTPSFENIQTSLYRVKFAHTWSGHEWRAAASTKCW